MSRIFSSEHDKEYHEINQDDVKEFFLERARKLKAGSLTYKQAIIYQDKEKNLAESRDDVEKALLFPKLSLSQKDRFLDVGCGTGRWAEVVADKVGYYHGTDLIPDLIDEAEQRLELVGVNADVKFTAMSCTRLSLDNLGEDVPFNKIICLGVLIYLNEVDVSVTLRAIASAAAKNCILMFREPIGIKARLTIKDHFSEDLGQQYNAIYRTESELLLMFKDMLGPEGFSLIESGDMFTKPEHNNRAETKQKYFLLERK